jgi:hypothetical protein
MRHQLFAITLLAAAVAAGACQKREAVPEVQQTSGVIPRSAPVIVTGCLRSGMADDAFVLTASDAADTTKTTTYQITGPGSMNLRQYVGQSVNVEGTVRAEEQIASSGGAVQEKPAKGTSGTPTVETKTDLNVKRLAVTSVKPTGNRCEK